MEVSSKPRATVAACAGTFVLLLLQVGCANGASPDPGLSALLHVSSAQYVPGTPPSGSDGGPQVTTINSTNNSVLAGQSGKKLDGNVDLPASAVAMHLKGDLGYWIFPTDAVDPTAPNQRVWQATLSLSPLIAPGTQTILIQGVDAEENFGLPATLDLHVQANIPAGDMVVSLAWDTEADLDLHVIDPNGIEIWSHKPTDFKPTQPPTPASEIKEYGHLDFDSNGACVIDGRRQENVVWGSKLQTGHYLVRVDTFSLCGQTAARWSVQTLLGGTLIGSATGQSNPSDTRFGHLAGAGVLALEFDVAAVPDGGG